MILQGRYRVLERIAEGAMGTVYRGERMVLGRPVAIKFLHAAVARDPQLADRFEVEARAMSRLSHPNCISVIDFGIRDLPYLVMDLVAGTPLRSLLEQGRLSQERAVSIARQMLAGLAHAHGHGIVHRDIKPENILVEQMAGFEDHVRILDFGMAKLMDRTSKLTMGLAVGTPHYMAPEQLEDGPVDARVDLYASGIVLYEMLTGAKPFDGTEMGEILLKHKRFPPPPFSQSAADLPPAPALEAIVRRALEKDPAARFATAMDMRAALEGVAAAAPPAPARAPLAPSDKTVFEAVPFGAAPATAGRRARRPTSLTAILRTRRWQVYGAAAAGGALAALLALGLPEKTPPPAPAPTAAPRPAPAPVPVPAPPKTVAAPAPPRPEPAPEPEPAPAPVPAVAPQPPQRPATTARRAAPAPAPKLDRKQTLARLLEQRKAQPRNPDHAVALARFYFDERRYADGVAAFRAAIRLDASRRNDPVLIRHVVDSLASDNFARNAEDFLRELGRSARPHVQEAAKSHKSPRVRERSRELLKHWEKRPWFRWW